MSTKETYTEDEWFHLTTLPPLIGAVVAAIDSSGLIGTVKEMSASMRAGMAAVKDYPSNELVQSIVGRQVDRKTAFADAKANHAKLAERAKETGAKTPEERASEVLSDCAKVADILDAKSTPEEAKEYKMWATTIAVDVAEAAKEGGWGFGDGGVSDKEAALLNEIRAALRCD